MKLSFWDGPNFGDQLNKYIFPRLFADVINDEEGIDIYGIGSIIDSRINLEDPAILFGTGLRDPFRDYTGHRWDIRFLRGPLSVRSFGPATPFIADAAYLLLLIDDFVDLVSSTKKRFRVSLMPWFGYAPCFPWRQLCSILDFHYIDPDQPSEVILSDIAASELVVAGAMHGAIVADICRVPWMRLRMDHYPSESHFLTEFKWADWVGALNIDQIPSVSISSVDLRSSVSLAKRAAFLLNAAYRFRSIEKRDFQLTKDKTLQKIKGQLDIERLKLIDEYAGAKH